MLENMPSLSGVDVGQFTVVISAIAALGTAAFGLVDASKAFRGGISNVGYGFIAAALHPFTPALQAVNKTDPYALIFANWINGMDKAEQKMTAKNLIRLGLNTENAKELAIALSTIDGDKLTLIAGKLEKGETPVDAELALLARFDAMIDSRLDAAFERAEQKYRNTSRIAAAAVAVVLAEIGAPIVYGRTEPGVFLVGLVVGLIAVPVAPIAKDLSSAISTSVAAFKAIKR